MTFITILIVKIFIVYGSFLLYMYYSMELVYIFVRYSRIVLDFSSSKSLFSFQVCLCCKTRDDCVNLSFEIWFS